MRPSNDALKFLVQYVVDEVLALLMNKFSVFLQAVPIPLSMASLALSSFVSSAKEVGFSFEVIHQGKDRRRHVICSTLCAFLFYYLKEISVTIIYKINCIQFFMLNEFDLTDCLVLFWRSCN